MNNSIKRSREIKRILTILLILVFVSCQNRQNEIENCPLPLQEVKNWAYQLQNADPDEIAASGFELIVMDYSRDGSEEGEYSPEEIQKIKQAGIIPIAYISIGEVENYRFYLDIIHNAGKPVFSVDYVDDGTGYTGANKTRIDDYRKKALNKGYIPYVAILDRELDELNVIEGVQP